MEKLVSFLSSCQCLMLLAKGVLWLFEVRLSWTLTLWPLWSLLFVVCVIWGLLITGIRAIVKLAS